MAKQPWYMVNSEEVASSFKHFYETTVKKGALDEKTKELLQLALACAFRCPHCTEEHIKKALDVGATKQEVTETLLITALEGSGTQLMWAKDLFEKYLGE